MTLYTTICFEIAHQDLLEDGTVISLTDFGEKYAFRVQDKTPCYLLTRRNCTVHPLVRNLEQILIYGITVHASFPNDLNHDAGMLYEIEKTITFPKDNLGSIKVVQTTIACVRKTPTADKNLDSKSRQNDTALRESHARDTILKDRRIGASVFYGLKDAPECKARGTKWFNHFFLVYCFLIVQYFKPS